MEENDVFLIKKKQSYNNSYLIRQSWVSLSTGNLLTLYERSSSVSLTNDLVRKDEWVSNFPCLYVLGLWVKV